MPKKELHQEGGRPQDVGNPRFRCDERGGDEEGLRKGRRGQTVTRLVGTMRASETRPDTFKKGSEGDEMETVRSRDGKKESVREDRIERR